jgi:putative NADH-flavin reductase
LAETGNDAPEKDGSAPRAVHEEQAEFVKIVLFGASGLTGRSVVAQGLAAGHQITAFVRDAARCEFEPNPKLHIMIGDVTRDQAAVADALQGSDVVISTLGSSQGFASMRAPTVIADAMHVIVGGMRKAGVRRLIFTSSLGVGDSIEAAPPLLRAVFRTVLRPTFADKLRAENFLRENDDGIDWTLVYPVLLTNGERTREYQSDERLELRGLPKISRADVADFIITQIDDTRNLGKAVVISH